MLYQRNLHDLGSQRSINLADLVPLVAELCVCLFKDTILLWCPFLIAILVVSPARDCAGHGLVRRGRFFRFFSLHAVPLQIA